jgi:hypothetical protein
VARGFKIADAFVEISGDKDQLRRDVASLPNDLGPVMDRAGKQAGERLNKGVTDEVKKLPGKVGPDAERGGRETGDKLSRGMQMALIRNSPLIAAAIAGALAAGAPVAIAGAKAMFAGIGIVAAAQSDKVRQAWLGTWDSIKSGAEQDAGVLVPILTGAAAQITRAFQQMRPELQDIFSAAAPQIQTFTESITRAAQNALPGLVDAVRNAGPVMDGLGNLVESVGTGLSDFFSGLSEHAPAAGASFTALGTAVGNLLPVLSDLLGTGVEVAQTFLPMLGGALGALHTVLQAVGPALPSLTAAIGGWKVGQLAAGWLGSAAGAVGKVGDALGGSEEGASGFASALSFVGDNAESISEKAGPILGAALGALTFAMQLISDQSTKWASALREGGKAADEARQEIAALSNALDTSQGGWGGVQAAALNFTMAGGMAHAMINQTTEALRAQWEAMSPLQQAQSKVAEWTKTLSERLQNQGASADDTQVAFRKLAEWTDKEREAQQQLEMATRGVTQAMIDQANAARGRTDAAFAYENALNNTEDATQALADAQAHLNDADEKTRTSQEDVERAALALQEAYKAQADAAEDAATTNLPASMDDNQKAIIGAKAALDELNGLMAQGIQLSPTLEAYRQQLIQITGQTDGAALAQAQLSAAVGELGFAVESVPGEKYITITAPTDALVQKLKDLGFWVVTLPNGDVTVEARTDEAKAHLGDLSNLLVGLGNQHPEPTPTINDAPFMAGYNVMMDVLHTLGVQTPTPVANVNPQPFNIGYGAIMGNIATLGSQRPTPVAGMTAGPFSAVWSAAMSNVATLAAQRPTPVASVVDNASGPLARILGGINALYSKTVYMTTVVQTIQQIIPGGSAAGGPVDAIPAIKAASGRVVGPGTGRSDSVSAMGPDGTPWRLSNGEWVVQERAVRQLERDYGAGAMSTINSGRLPTGGHSATRDGGVTITPTAGGATISVGQLHVHVKGIFDLTNKGEIRRLGLQLREVILGLEREGS